MENGKKNNISVRQLIIMFIILIAPTTIRIIPFSTASIAKQASWVTTFVLLIFYIPLLYVLYKFLNLTEDGSLQKAYEKIVGKKITKIIMIIYIIWLFFILAVNLRYFSERYISTIMVNAEMEFFSVSILMLVFVIAKKNIEYFARFNEIFMVFLVFFIVGMLTLPSYDVKITNLFPVTTLDIIPVFKSVYSELGIFSYITFLFCLGDSVSNRKSMKKYIIILPIFTVIINTALILCTVGIFGANVTENLSMPFFSFLKNINIFSPVIERFESIFISLWIAADLSILVSFILVLLNINKYTFNVKSKAEFVTPIIFFVYFFSNYFGNNIFEIGKFSEIVGQSGNVVFCFGVPILIYIIGKIRKIV